MGEPDLSRVRFPPVEEFLKNGEFTGAREECGKFPESFRIVHIPWGLFERSWALRGFENALMDMAVNEPFYGRLLDRITGHLMLFVEKALELPIDGVMFGDDWGGQQGLMMGAERWRRFFKPRYRELYGRARDAGKAVLTHCCGNIEEILPDVIEIGLDVYESFQPEVMDIYAVKKKWGDKLTFWGGLGAQSIIPFGTPEEIRQEVSRMKQELPKGGGFILAPAKEPPEETPAVNLAALLEGFTA
jgi:uroporphyrinogen decarboxylase